MVAQARTDTTLQTIDGVLIDLGLSGSELARALGIAPETLRRWRTDALPPEVESARRLQHLSAVASHLNETFGTRAGVRWLRSESRYLGGQRPLDALLAGEFDRVEAALEALDSGIFI